MNKPLAWPHDWPMPLGYAPAEEAPARQAETCLAAFNDGTSLIGQLQRFAPDDGVIELRTRGATEARLLILSDLKSLYLTRLLTPVAEPVDARAAVPGLPATGRADRFELTFFDGEQLSGETWGFIADDRGLFLFLVHRGRALTRFFAPAGAVRGFRMLDHPDRPGAAPSPVAPAAPQAAHAPVEPANAAPAEASLAPLPTKPSPKLSAQPAHRPDRHVEAAEILTLDDLARAIERLKTAPWLKLGDALIQEGCVTPAQLQDALQRQQQGTRLPLGDLLVEMGLLDRPTVNRLLARQFGIPHLELGRFQAPDPRALELVPVEACRRLVALPLGFARDGALVVAMEDPISRDALQELAFSARRKILPVMANAHEVLRELDRAHGAPPVTVIGSGAALAEQLAVASEAAPDEDAEPEVAENDSTLVRLVNKVILEAIEQGASDIHVETYPDRQNTRVRIRKDGILVTHLEIPAAVSNAFISRIKIMCQLDIAERRKPQDGKIKFRKFGPADVELRVATIPTANGLEDVVMRVLAAGKPIPLDQLGLSPDNHRQLTRVAARPHGLCLVCGPTGSGKTTTLHSVLHHVNVPGRKIWTAEDPIEITQAGLRQVQVNPRIGWTFAAAMRTFLRADPDIIMLGEIRDAETARVAIEGSLTGHFVYSTLHTNSAPESIVRLLDLGADPFNFADALLGILAQRLARRLCVQCRQPHTATPEEIHALVDEYCLDSALDPARVRQDWQTRFANAQGRFTLFTAAGCPACSDSGYRGRLGLHEFFVVSPATKRLVQVRATVAELLAAASAEGMRTLKQDGIEKVLMGLTDIHQVRAVCG